MPMLVMQTWTESEAGWGQSSDGTSFHLNVEDMKVYNKVHCDALPKDVPTIYTRPDANPVDVEVTEELFKKVAESPDKCWRTWRRFKVVTSHKLIEA